MVIMIVLIIQLYLGRHRYKFLYVVVAFKVCCIVVPITVWNVPSSHRNLRELRNKENVFT